MSRYWVIAPYNSKYSQIFDKAWQYDIENSVIAVGWKELGDISQLSKQEIEAKYKGTYKATPKNVASRDINSLWAFYHEISPGDTVIARRGTKKVIGIGTVTGVPFHDTQKGQQRVADLAGGYYPNFLPVEWEEKELSFDEIVFSFYTLYRIDDERYRELITTLDHTPPLDESITRGVSIASPLEQYLEGLIAENFERIFNGQLEIYSDPEGNLGKQYNILGENDKSIGRIDILAFEPNTNSFVVIELKKDVGSDRVVGQILRYMGWVKQNLCQTGENVKGLIICNEIDERLDYAVQLVRDIVKIKLYQLDIRLIDPLYRNAAQPGL